MVLYCDLMNRDTEGRTLGRTETIAYLRELIARLQGEIIALSVDKEKARQLFEQIRALESSIENTPAATPPQKFSRYKRAIDAVEVLLKETGKPMEREQIVAQVVSGGFRPGQEDSSTSVRKSIGHHAETEQGLRKKKLRMFGELVGLYEWDADAKRPQA